VPEEKHDAQLMLIMAISAFGDSTTPTFISKNKTFDKVSLAAQQLFEGHDYTIGTAEKTFIIEVFLLPGYKMCFAQGCDIYVKGISNRAKCC
jgi:hypothetical protein